MLVFGAVDFGFMYNRNILVTNVARDGARVASLNGTATQIRAAMVDELAGYGLPTAGPRTVLTLDCLKANKAPCNASSSDAAYDAAKESGGTAVITVSYVYKPITPMGSTLAGDSMNLTQVVKMRIE